MPFPADPFWNQTRRGKTGTAGAGVSAVPAYAATQDMSRVKRIAGPFPLNGFARFAVRALLLGAHTSPTCGRVFGLGRFSVAQFLRFTSAATMEGNPIRPVDVQRPAAGRGDGKVPASFRSPSITRVAGRPSGSKVSASFIVKFLPSMVTLNHEGKVHASTVEG